ncbi:glycoside hydrolase family 15 protein [Oculatella sp. LEGE 06141]|uniref:glycoside hydrolase family 15 protein n=1 Tax=Oculatella sp. LEGE 06141 TaxID=1828648 RepID=UPI001881C5E5|nr:glycoside hydrolase family 15 protein [Oculatella sp. LEGE 06141]MBE9180438.1 glycoside hydrolase family 15 protein [Oculatella sp. LEGE 06141]
MAYQPIENYGIIGNMHTTALVGLDGAIDWFCFPRHDSPSVFAALLDEHKGGSFKIFPTTNGLTHKQFYWPETNVLMTRFLSSCGVGEIVDFMPVGLQPDERGYHWLVRRVRVIRCTMTFRMECRPAFNYARDPHETHITENGAQFKSPNLSLGLVTDRPLTPIEGGIATEFTLEAGETAVFVLRELSPKEGCGMPLDELEAEGLFEHTVEYWRKWVSQCTYTGRWREIVERSALALKLLTYEPTGAIVAAPTCGLPEEIGGSRNWDYRYTWIRDAAFTLYALLRIGFKEEAAQFMQWIEQRCHELEPDGSLQAVYGIDGRHNLEEEVLDHLEGYRGSAPVRVGNNAYKQLQLDIYGELLDAAYLYNKHGAPISYDLWTYLRRLVNWVCDNWQQPDEGIWEVRDGRQHFVYSKLMCWVAIDRGLRLADKRSFPADRDRWLKTRDEIYEEIIRNGWSPKREAFVQHYGSDSLDASALIMPLVFFLSPSDPRMLDTLKATLRSPSQGGLVSNSLVYRYNLEDASDGLDGGEGTFNLCTFWLVEAVTRAGRIYPERLSEARLMFEEMLSYANHLGLYAEETGHSGEALGNYPQAFTHLALISSAWNLSRAVREKN